MKVLPGRLQTALKYVGVLTSVVFISNATAGGFQLWEQDESDLGDYHAGAAAEAKTAGVEYYNVAGITRIKHKALSLGATLISIGLDYTGSNGNGGTITAPLPGGTTNIVPNFHIVLPLSDRWAFSFGSTTPFGLETNYPSPAGAFVFPTKTKLESINLNPGLAYAVNRYLSVGVGFDLLWGAADYNEHILTPSVTSLTGWNCGYNVGLLFELSKETRLGLSYRSDISVDAKGDSQSGSLKTKASATLPLPGTAMLSLYHAFTPRFSLMGSVVYTDWSVFRELLLKNIATVAGATSVTINENYRNTWNIGLGAKYRYSHFLSFEAGFGHDQTPTQLFYRDIRLPDNNRYALSFGVNVTPEPGMIWSVGMTHFFLPDTTVDNSKSNGIPKMIGVAKGDINVIGVQVSKTI